MASLPSTDSSTDRQRVVEIRRTPLIETLLRPELGFPSSMSLSIHPDDEMLRFMTQVHDGDRDRGLADYLYSGLRAFTMTDQLVSWRFGGFEKIRMLDFAAGYGRVTRHLLGKIDRRRLTVSDIMEEAVDFQRRTFQVDGVVSTVDPDALDLSGRFEVVQAISLFTHLPEDLFRRWLRKLWSHVEPGGMLILSVHDTSLLTVQESEEGFIFLPSSENDRLDPESYGSTWVREELMARVFKEELSGYSFQRLARGLCGYQDVYAVVKQERVRFESLRFDSGAEGHIDLAETDDSSRLVLRGWAAAVNRGQTLKSIELVLNGRVLSSFKDFAPRPDVAAFFGDERLVDCGWEIVVDLPAGVSYSHDVVMLVAHTEGGRTVFNMGCVYSLLALAAKNNLKFLLANQGQ